MMKSFDISRRKFVVGGTMAGLALGFQLPLASRPARASAGFPDEINAWVVVKP